MSDVKLIRGGNHAIEQPEAMMLDAFKNEKHSSPTQVCQGIANQFMHRVNPGDPSYTWFTMIIENHEYQQADDKIVTDESGQYAEYSINNEYRIVVK